MKDLGADSSSTNIMSDMSIVNLEKFYKRVEKEYNEYIELFFPSKKLKDQYCTNGHVMVHKRFSMVGSKVIMCNKCRRDISISEIKLKGFYQCKRD